MQLRKYSKGMLQRIGIAQALVNDPTLVLLDEPMTGLDPIGRLEVKRIIQRLHERGQDRALQLAHPGRRRGALHAHRASCATGVVVWTGTVREALEQAPTLEDFFMRTVEAAP